MIALATLLAACSGHLRVTSNPEKSKVELVSQNSGTIVALGETPLLLTSSEMSKKNIPSPYIIRISKEGYAPKDLLVSSLVGVSIDYLIELSPYPVTQRTNAMINSLFQAQMLAQAGKYADSLTLLENLRKEFPNVAAIAEMQGSIQMLKGNYELASENFTHALNLDPDNTELKALLNSAQKAIGRTPASGGER